MGNDPLASAAEVREARSPRAHACPAQEAESANAQEKVGNAGGGIDPFDIPVLQRK